MTKTYTFAWDYSPANASQEEFAAWKESSAYKWKDHNYMSKISPRDRVELFDQVFGGGEPPVEYDNKRLFVTGAMRETLSDAGGALVPPPEDAYQRNKLVLTYWNTRVADVTREFNRKRKEIASAARNSINAPFPHATFVGDPDIIDDLKRLKAGVLKLKKKAAEAEKAVNDSKPIHISQREETDARAREHTSKFLAELEELKL